MKGFNTSIPPPGMDAPGYRQSRFRRLAHLLLAAATGILVWSVVADNGLEVEFADDWIMSTAPRSFQDIVPSTELKWVPCFRDGGSFLCARLVVPMDYHRPLEDSPEHPTVELALILLPGEGRGEYGSDDNIVPANFSTSPLLVNPGGPGGSGVDIVKGLGHVLQAVVGRDQDILGFDPRGVASSTPRADCFFQARVTSPGAEPELPTDKDAFMRRILFEVGEHEVGIVNSSHVALSKLNARSRAMNQLCEAKDAREGKDDMLRYAGTPNVARDMLSIVHAWDAWQGYNTSSGITEPSEAMASDDMAQDTRGKLVYWGFSYGTLLGATFSAMFPDKVGRVILDGVCDADHYVSPTWYDSLIDADAIWDSFFKYCHGAKEKCTFYHPSYTVEDLRARYQAIEDDLRKDPVILITPAKSPVLITFSDLKSVIFGALYMPITAFPLVASILVQLEARQLNLLSVALPMPDGCLPELPRYPDDSTRAVMCGDKRYPLNQTLSELQGAFERIGKYSRFADRWMTLMLMCSHYNIPSSDPPMRWGKKPQDSGAAFLDAAKQASGQVLLGQPETGDFLEILSAVDRKIETNFPLLFMTNTYDPVTPKAAAMKMTQKFSNARFLEQKALGHCTVSASSLCTLMNVRAYIREGVLPKNPDFEGENWTVCEADEHPWSLKAYEKFMVARASETSDVSRSDVELLLNWNELQKTLAGSSTLLKYGQPSMSEGAALLWEMMGANDVPV